jgi:hypothetical protein
MSPLPMVMSDPGRIDEGDGHLAATELFAIAWDALADILGTAAVAAIVRRAAGRAAAEHPELRELTVSRRNLEYACQLPEAWSRQPERGRVGLRVLVAEIGVLLRELTGTVVIGRMEQIPELRSCGLSWRGKVAN